MRRAARWRVRARDGRAAQPPVQQRTRRRRAWAARCAHGSTRDANASKTSVIRRCRLPPRARAPCVRRVFAAPSLASSRPRARGVVPRHEARLAPRVHDRRRGGGGGARAAQGGAALRAVRDTNRRAAQRDDEEDDGLEQQDQVARRHRALHPREDERGDRRRHAGRQSSRRPTRRRSTTAWGPEEEESRYASGARQRRHEHEEQRVVSWILSLWVFVAAARVVFGARAGRRPDGAHTLGSLGYTTLPLVLARALVPLVGTAGRPASAEEVASPEERGRRRRHARMRHEGGGEGGRERALLAYPILPYFYFFIVASDVRVHAKCEGELVRRERAVPPPTSPRPPASSPPAADHAWAAFARRSRRPRRR